MHHSEQMTARLPPPLLYFGMLVLGLILSALFPTPILSGPLPTLLGALLVVLGLALAVWATITMRRAGESPNATEATRTLVASGPFAFTRNPLYIALALVYAGIALALGSLWALLLLVVVLVIMDRGVIASEERYLRGQLGDPYAQYTARVRRWL